MADPEPLGTYPTDALDEIAYLTRCAGLARALTQNGIDFDHYAPHVPSEFNNKITDFGRTLRRKAMSYFGFDPDQLTVMDDGRNQLPHVLIVTLGIDATIDRRKGFYSTMSRFRQKPEWDAIVISDLATCAKAPVQ